MDDFIVVNGINKSFGLPFNKEDQNRDDLRVLTDVSFKVKVNEFVSILGPSGCGKSTLLKLIAGLDNDYDGEISLNGINPRDQHVPVCYSFQKDCLMPWRSMLSNILLPVEIRKGDLKKRREELKPLLNEFGLSGFENYRPFQLSGGMRQRAALLRTYLMEGDIMLLDEPFGALDELTRMQMQNWLINIWERHKKTVLFVTHDLDEAIFLSDRILVMGQRPGTITADIPIKYSRPRSRELTLNSEFLEYKKRIIEAISVV